MKLLAVFLLLLIPFVGVAQQVTITKVKVRFKDEKKGHQIDREASLTLDSTAGRLLLNAPERPQEIKQADVLKIIVEPDSHAGNIGFGAFLVGMAVGGPLFGGKIATSINKPLEAAHVVYIEYKDGKGSAAPLVLVLDKDAAPEGLSRIQHAFAERIELPSFDEQPEKLDKDKFKSPGKLKIRGSLTEHPLPQIRVDKALVVVAGPVGGTLRPKDARDWTPFYAKIAVNGEAVAANTAGTYSYFYLDPGSHLLVTQAMVNAKVTDVTGLRLTVEAGKDYYLMQTIYIGGGLKSFLTRHSKEVVMREVSDLLWSEWKTEK